MMEKPVNNSDNSPEILNDTLSFIAAHGYCLWRCQAMGGQVIIIVDRDVPAGAPTGYPVYNLEELGKIEPLPASTIKLINTAKRLAGAIVTSVFSVRVCRR
jgi:hypothetical protein